MFHECRPRCYRMCMNTTDNTILLQLAFSTSTGLLNTQLHKNYILLNMSELVKERKTFVGILTFRPEKANKAYILTLCIRQLKSSVWSMSTLLVFFWKAGSTSRVLGAQMSCAANAFSIHSHHKLMLYKNHSYTFHLNTLFTSYLRRVN